MKISRVRILSFELPFIQPVPVQHSTIHRRKGFLLHLISDEGHEGFGETAPLPGLHRETLTEALAALKTAAQGLRGLRLPPGELEEFLGSAFPSQQALPPSVRFGLDMALTNLLAACRNMPVASLLNPNSPDTLWVNGLASGQSAEAVLDSARGLFERGYRTVKVKVAGRPVESDINVFTTLYKLMSYKYDLIPDSNRGWTMEQAVRFAGAIHTKAIPYLEEPLQDPSLLQALHEKTGLRLGLDETLTETPDTRRLPLKGVGAFILKPDTLGPLARLKALSNLANSRGALPVISSSFNTGPGLLFLAELGAALSPAGSHAGLDTHRQLARDVLAHRLPDQGGKWDLKILRSHSGKLNQRDLTIMEEWG